MASNTKKDYTQMHIKASEHPKAYSPHILILNIDSVYIVLSHLYSYSPMYSYSNCETRDVHPTAYLLLSQGDS